LFFRVTLLDAIELGLLDTINETRGTSLTKEQFIADCRARAGLDEIFEQTYMCNPVPAGASIVEWSAIERCRSDYKIERTHLDHQAVRQHFGEFLPHQADDRESLIAKFLQEKFPVLFSSSSSSLLPIENRKSKIENSPYRLGFDVAASGQGDLAVFYLDQVAVSKDLWLRALLTARTEDWHFLKTVLFYFLDHVPRIQAAGDETGLGRQICWEAARHYGSRFLSVNFSSKKQDLGFALMNQLSNAEKHFPASEQDIAADYFALRKSYSGTKWIFTEGRNTFNSASHCDIAWAGALASEAHNRKKSNAWAYVA
jgi:phage FluMu gp28-like protein